MKTKLTLEPLHRRGLERVVCCLSTHPDLHVDCPSKQKIINIIHKTYTEPEAHNVMFRMARIKSKITWDEKNHEKLNFQ